MASGLDACFGSAFSARCCCQSFFSIDKAATTRKIIPAQNRLPVKNQTTNARSTAGMSIMSKRMSMMIIMPIMTRTTRAIMSIWGMESKMPKTA
jgi:hypothetical protein